MAETSLQTTQTQTMTDNQKMGTVYMVAGLGVALISLVSFLFDQPRHTTTTSTGRYYRR